MDLRLIVFPQKCRKPPPQFRTKPQGTRGQRFSSFAALRARFGASDHRKGSMRRSTDRGFDVNATRAGVAAVTLVLTLGLYL